MNNAPRFARGLPVVPLRLAWRHRGAIVFLMLVLGILVAGLLRADFPSAPQTPAGLLDAALAGEKRLLSDLCWAVIAQADRLIVFAIDLTSRIAAEFTARFLLYLRGALQAQASPPCP